MEAVTKGRQHFCGVRALGIVEVWPNKEKIILKAAQDLGFVSNPSPPNMDIKNPVAESAMQNREGFSVIDVNPCWRETGFVAVVARALEQAYGVNVVSRIIADPLARQRVNNHLAALVT